MKKIINGKRYNTESAKEIGYWEYDITNSLDGFAETLYRKRTGEFFAYGDGGARTVYAHKTPSGGWVGGEDIRPLTDAEARDWIKAHCSAETYEQLFDVNEDTAVADEIKALRKSTGLTQVEFCDKYGIPRRTLGNWECSVNCPPAYVVELLKYRVEH